MHPLVSSPGIDRFNKAPVETNLALRGREMIEEREFPFLGEHPAATHFCGLFGIPVIAWVHACQFNLQTDKLRTFVMPVLVEPIGKHKSDSIVIGVLGNRPQKGNQGIHMLTSRYCWAAAQSERSKL